MEVLSSICINGKAYHEKLVNTLIQAVFLNTQVNKDDKLYIYLQNHTEGITYLQFFSVKLIMQYE